MSRSTKTGASPSCFTAWVKFLPASSDWWWVAWRCVARCCLFDCATSRSLAISHKRRFLRAGGAAGTRFLRGRPRRRGGVVFRAFIHATRSSTS